MRQQGTDLQEIEPRNKENQGKWNKFGVAVGVIAAVLFLMNLRDLNRYLKISAM